MFCPNCGTQNADGTAFCAGCGSNLSAQQAPVQQPVYQQPAYQQPAYQQPVYRQPASVPGKGLGVTGMVLGIVALVLFCYAYISIPCAIIGAALSGVSMKKAQEAGMKNGLAVAGLVCSVVALAICVVYLILAAAAIAEFNAAMDSLF